MLSPESTLIMTVSPHFGRSSISIEHLERRHIPKPSSIKVLWVALTMYPQIEETLAWPSFATALVLTEYSKVFIMLFGFVSCYMQKYYSESM